MIDLRTGAIPNWLTLGLFGAAPLARAALAFHDGGSVAPTVVAAATSLFGGIASALLPALVARKGGLGMGDVKLFAAIGAACGGFVALYAQTYAYVVALVYALGLLLRRKQLKSTLVNVKMLLSRRRGGQSADLPGTHAFHGFTEVRFGPAILAGMCIAAWARWNS
jgi:prepilin peptidase CpaA